MGLLSRFLGGQKNKKDLLILYGTKSGNAKLIAEQTQKYFQKNGVDSLCQNMAGYKPVNLAEINNLLVIVSTHGEGEPPPSSTAFFDECMGDQMPKLNQLNYSICALGDSSYSEYCWAGRTLDKRFKDLGAKSFFPRQDCDLEFSNDAIQWIKNTAIKYSDRDTYTEPESPEEISIDGNKQYSAKLKARKKLTIGENVSSVYHLELDISDSKLEYSVGDSIGIQPQNPESLVELIVQFCNNDFADERSLSIIRENLLNDYELTTVSKSTIEGICQFTKSESLKLLLKSDEKLQEYMAIANIYDLLKDYKLKIKISDLLSLLPRLKERIYSIASSQRLKPAELHLTVKTIQYKFNARNHWGTGSNYINEYLEENSILNFKLYRNESFCLPDNSQTPIIMIGVSTGIAPFRAILQDRQAKKLKGNTWLIWGNKKAQEDFIYKEELQAFGDNGVLEKMDTVFSRDGNQIAYVSDLLQNKKVALISWITKGAYIYICGSTKMGYSVKNTLDDLLAPANSSTKKLRNEGRYFEDLY